MRLDIGRIQASDLDAIRRLHVHFLGEVSDVDAMADTLARLDGAPDHILLAALSMASASVPQSM